MKLLELLVKERIKWPEGVNRIVQDHDGEIKAVNINDKGLHLADLSVWMRDEGYQNINLGYISQSDDWQTAIVTKEQYDQACKLVDEGYILWFGGECPVQGDTRVDVWVSTGEKGEAPYFTAKHWRWEWEDGLDNIIAYRIELGVENSIRLQLTPLSMTNCRCVPQPVYSAHRFLEKGVQHMKDRAAQRDSVEGERSMAACVNAFNAMFGTSLTETQGWQFMVLLKMARSRNKFNPDDYEDGAAYTGLAGEAHSHE